MKWQIATDLSVKLHTNGLIRYNLFNCKAGMQKFKVQLHGQNFLLNFDGEHKKFGFHATRFVMADNQQDAERIAIIQIHQYHAIRDALANEGTDSPVVTATETHPVTFFKSLFHKSTGTFSFYPEENEQGMRCISGPNSYN